MPVNDIIMSLNNMSDGEHWGHATVNAMTYNDLIWYMNKVKGKGKGEWGSWKGQGKGKDGKGGKDGNGKGDGERQKSLGCCKRKRVEHKREG